MVDANRLTVEYVAMTPTQRALWRKQLVALFAYVKTIDLAATVPVAHSCIGQTNDTPCPRAPVSYESSRNETL
jgi:hypothetical protein